MPQSWELVAKRKREEVLAKIPPEWLLPESTRSSIPRNVHQIFDTCGILNQKDLEITNSPDATTIIESLRRKKWSAKEVTTAFCKRAAIAHQLVNCLMDINFDAALLRAAELDDHLERTDKVVGPLHGLPVSIKDLTEVKGMHISYGFVAWADRISSEDAVVVQSLRAAGAIIYVKTTMPQTGMALETNSNLWGRTLNPTNTSLSAGGSSGGEAALVACRGSPIGILTDIGGSIRCPANFNGLYAIKPSSKRFSYLGCLSPAPGQISIASAVGPGGRSLQDLEIICQLWSDHEHWRKDPNVVPMPWRSKPTPEHVTIGVMWDDRIVLPHPPIRRALKNIVQKLKAAGHEVIDFEPYKHDYAWEVTRQLYFPTAASRQKEIMAEAEEPIIPPAIKLLENLHELSAAECMAYNAKMTTFQTEYLQHWNRTASLTPNGKPVDAVIMPGMPCASFPHNFYPWWGYCSTWNLLNYPAITLPVGHVDKHVDVADQSYVPLNEIDKANHEIYNPELFDGTPVSLQLVGQFLEEETLVSIARRLDMDAIR